MSPLLGAIGCPQEASGAVWLPALLVDVAALHIAAFVVEEFIVRVLGQGEGESTAMMHFHLGIRLLRERLLGDDDAIMITDSTVGAVVKLIGAAAFNQDFATARDHMQGLGKMVKLRGGLEGFRDKSMVLELIR